MDKFRVAEESMHAFLTAPDDPDDTVFVALTKREAAFINLAGVLSAEGVKSAATKTGPAGHLFDQFFSETHLNLILKLSQCIMAQKVETDETEEA